MLHASRTHVQEVSCDVWKDDDGGGLSVWRVERNFADLTVVFGSNDEPIPIVDAGYYNGLEASQNASSSDGGRGMCVPGGAH